MGDRKRQDLFGRRIYETSRSVCPRKHRTTNIWKLSFSTCAKWRSSAGTRVVREYTDTISGAKAKRVGLDQLLADARRHRFDIVLVSAFDRVARNVRHFLEVLDELNHLGIEFVSLRENIDTGGPLGRAMVVIVGAIAQVERQAIVESVSGRTCAGPGWKGRQIGRAPLRLTVTRCSRDRGRGMSLSQIGEAHRISKASVCRIVKEPSPRLRWVHSDRFRMRSGQRTCFVNVGGGLGCLQGNTF